MGARVGGGGREGGQRGINTWDKHPSCSTCVGHRVIGAASLFITHFQ
jgi:hypothetical protein